MKYYKLLFKEVTCIASLLQSYAVASDLVCTIENLVIVNFYPDDLDQSLSEGNHSSES